MTGDAREVLARTAAKVLAGYHDSDERDEYETEAGDIADAILAAGFTLPRTVEPTDGQVEAACREWWDRQAGPNSGEVYMWDDMASDDPSRADLWRDDMRAALRASAAVLHEPKEES